MSGTGTRTASSTETFAEQVLRVTRPVLTDLLAIVEMYGHLTEDDAYKYILDFRDLMNERYLENIEACWTSNVTRVVVDGLKYIIVNGEAVRAMNRPGGIAYNATVAASNFKLIIRYTPLWHSRTAAEQAAFNKKLRINWGPVAPLNYGRGSYVAEGHEYGAASVAVSRLRFKNS